MPLGSPLTLGMDESRLEAGLEVALNPAAEEPNAFNDAHDRETYCGLLLSLQHEVWQSLLPVFMWSRMHQWPTAMVGRHLARTLSIWSLRPRSDTLSKFALDTTSKSWFSDA